jgi:hypothetical protein
MFRTTPNGGISLLREFQEQLRQRGAYLLIVSHGIPGGNFTTNGVDGPVAGSTPARPDLVALLPTADQFEAVKLIATDGNGQHDNAEIVAWLRELNQAQAFILFGAGIDFVDGIFPEPVRDPRGLAHRIYSFCPDTWDSGPALFEPGPPEVHLAEHLERDRAFFCWWD